MADRLSKVYGTEMDKVNCPFFYKIGACRYGDSCERIHNKPPLSQTVLLQHMYENNPIETALISGNNVSSADAEKAMEKFQQFYEDVFKQMSQYGEIEDMIIVDNIGDHIIGNVYVKYSEQEYAENAHKNINGRFFGGKKIDAQFSPVTDFLNAKCKQYMDGSCKRGGCCNYMHVKPLSKSFKKDLFEQMYLQHPQYRVKKKEDSDSWDNKRDWDRKRNNRNHHDRRDNDRREKDHYRERSRDRKQKDKYREREEKSRKSREKSRDRKKEKSKKKHKSDSDSERGSAQRREMISKWNADVYK